MLYWGLRSGLDHTWLQTGELVKGTARRDILQASWLSCMVGLLSCGFIDPSAALQEKHVACLEQEGLSLQQTSGAPPHSDKYKQ